MAHVESNIPVDSAVGALFEAAANLAKAWGDYTAGAGESSWPALAALLTQAHIDVIWPAEFGEHNGRGGPPPEDPLTVRVCISDADDLSLDHYVEASLTEMLDGSIEACAEDGSGANGLARIRDALRDLADDIDKALPAELKVASEVDEVNRAIERANSFRASALDSQSEAGRLRDRLEQLKRLKAQTLTEAQERAERAETQLFATRSLVEATYAWARRQLDEGAWPTTRSVLEDVCERLAPLLPPPPPSNDQSGS